MTAVQNSPSGVAPLSSMPRGTALKADARLGLWGTWAALALAAFVIVAALWQGFTWQQRPYLGALFTRMFVIDGTQPIGGYWEGLASGLRRGDQLLALDGEPLVNRGYGSEHAQLEAILSRHQVGDVIPIEFRRPVVGAFPVVSEGMTCGPVDDGYATCQVSLQLTAFPPSDFIALFVIPYLAGVVLFISSLVVLILRSQQAAGRLVALVCALLSIFAAGLFDLNTFYLLSPVWLFGTSFLGGALVALSFNFPMRWGRLYQFPRLQWLPFGVAALAGVASLGLYLFPTQLGQPLLAIQVAVLATMLGALAAYLLWSRQRARATLPLLRDQASIIVVGLLFGLVPGIFWGFNLIARALTGSEAIPFNTSAVAPFFMLPAFSMAYAVLQTRIANTDVWISRGITYTFLALALVIGYSLLVLGVTLATGRYVEANNPLAIALVIFVIAIAFVPLRIRLQAMVDKVYFRQRIHYQNQVEQFARRLSLLRDLNAIADDYRLVLEQTLAPQHVLIFLPNLQTGEFSADNQHPSTDICFSAESPLLQYLKTHENVVYLDQRTPWSEAMVAERARLLVLKPLLLAGFRGSNLGGFVVIGPPRSGSQLYTYDEQQFVESLTNQVAVAVERAQVVGSLQRRVRELDILSRVSQAVNFTGDFDQLLELISTQTMKLIEASHVYIALRDAAMNELYYAFFLEDGDRYPNRENQRWRIGSDLVSEVVRSGQTLRVNSFSRAMADLNAPIVREDKRLIAWMGVPLIAGSRVLGVLAVANTELNRPFSDEQKRLLGDVGSLAATSLDKARLFGETNLRARQLAALNEISRKLVASEQNLDNLLQLITESAADILDAEAGSLLLTHEDGSGDLEFRVDVGSQELDLVGRRVPAGEGLVGECARSGRLIMVNDAANDPRLAAVRVADSYPTRNVLAAPLITQNRVIGVLEIINRREGGFTNEDADVLTTLAGQAAVAIENARLFQLTDLQLQDRLEELETLERIDAEMNRSLDLVAVSEIALRWAMSNTEATAGLIGLVAAGDPPWLQVVASAGYQESDRPSGAEGSRWPLDRGIVSRVYKRQQAELVSDVRLDPLYVPSLSNAVSQITVPMLSGTDVIALLVLESNQTGRLHLADMPFAQRLAEHASIAIANAQLYEQLARANASKSEFVSFVAHELKNPLTSIKGYSDVLITGSVGGLSDMQRQFIGTIRSNAERMNTLVSDLNDVTKLQTNNLRIEPAHVEFPEVVEETLRPLQKQIDDKGQQVILNFADPMPSIYADRNRVIQVLTNLLSNAYKYSPEGSKITISAVVEAMPSQNHGASRHNVLHVQVRDEGIGMSAEDLGKLFTPYFRSENPAAREQPGTGLGMTITRGIIERHGGRIWVESDLGQGTSFHFTLPLTEAVKE